MNDKLPPYVNPKTGNFTSVGLDKNEKSDEECFKSFEGIMETKLYKSAYWKSLTEEQKQAFHNDLRVQIKTGNINPNFLLTMAMPPAMEPFKEFQAKKPKIHFELPPQYCQRAKVGGE